MVGFNFVCVKMLFYYIDSIPIFLEKKHVKNINLRINKHCEVHVSAPYFTSDKKITNFVNQKKQWIIKSVDKQRIINKRESNLKKYNTETYKNELIIKAKPVLSYYQKLTSLSIRGIRAKYMTSMWGNYNKRSDLITLNTALLAYNHDVLEYVVLHELLHKKYFNHGPQFKDALTNYMPNWKAIKKQLKC